MKNITPSSGAVEVAKAVIRDLSIEEGALKIEQYASSKAEKHVAEVVEDHELAVIPKQHADDLCEEHAKLRAFAGECANDTLDRISPGLKQKAREALGIVVPKHKRGPWAEEIRRDNAAQLEEDRREESAQRMRGLNALPPLSPGESDYDQE